MRLAAGLGICALLAACWTEVRPSRPELPAAPSTADQPAPVAEAPAAPTAPPTATVEVDAEQLAPPLPSIKFADLEGASQTSAKQWFQATPEMLSRCEGTKGNIVRVYVSARNGDVIASLDESDASASTAACALETIAFELDNALAPSVSPSERANNVESMIILNW